MASYKYAAVTSIRTNKETEKKYSESAFVCLFICLFVYLSVNVLYHRIASLHGSKSMSVFN